MEDTGINSAIQKEIQILRVLVYSVPWIVQPILKAAHYSHKILRFVSPVCDLEILKQSQVPNMKLYDGATDLEEHAAQYLERMKINCIPQDLKETCLCRGFDSILTGATLEWLLSVPPFFFIISFRISGVDAWLPLKSWPREKCWRWTPHGASCGRPASRMLLKNHRPKCRSKSSPPPFSFRFLSSPPLPNHAYILLHSLFFFLLHHCRRLLCAKTRMGLALVQLHRQWTDCGED